MNVLCSATPCPVILNSTCVFYEGANLLYIGVNTNDSIQTALEKINYSLSNFSAPDLQFVTDVGAITTNKITVTGIDVNLANTNKGVVIESGTSSTGNPIEVNKNGVNKLTVNQQGEVTATKLIKEGGTSSQFLKADGSIDSNTYATTSGVILTTTDQTFNGIKSSINTGTSQINGLNLTNNGTTTNTFSIKVLNTNSGFGINAINNLGGNAIQVTNNGYGSGINVDSSDGVGVNIIHSGAAYGLRVDNSNSGEAIHIDNTSNGKAILVRGSSTSTGFLYVGQNDITNTFTVNKDGNVTGNSFVKSGGLSTQFLMADGSVTTGVPYKYNFSGSLTLTGTLTTTNLLTITIPANSLTDYLDIRSIMVQQSGTALAGMTVRVWHNVNTDFNTATRIANYAFGGGGADLFAQITRKFSIQSGQLFGFPALGSNVAGEGSTANAALSIPFNPTAINYLFVSVQLNNATDTAILRNVNITN